MKKIKICEATNNQLDWLMATIEGYTNWDADTETFTSPAGKVISFYNLNWFNNHEKVGQLMARERISVVDGGYQWCATTHPVSQVYRDNTLAVFQGCGKTHLIAVIRCFIVTKLGYEAEVPEGV